MSDSWLEGGCHCERVRFRVRGRPARLLECNCSICTMKGYLHWIVEPADVELLSPTDAVATYRFGTRQAQHHFCPVCGVSPYYIARSDPDKLDVNARCVRGLDLAAIPREPFDGRDWDQAFADYSKSPA